VWGPPGVGKTALVAKLAEQHAGPKAWITCDSRTDAHVVAGGIARAAGLGGQLPRLNAERDLRALAIKLSEAGGLLVLDDFHRADAELVDLLYMLDEVVVGGGVVVLSRTPIHMVPSRGCLIPLAPLDKSSSLTLLRGLGLDLSEDELGWIYEATGGNPRLLVAVAKIVESTGFDEDRIREALEALIDPLVSSLERHEYEVLKAVSVFNEPVPAAAVARVSSVKNAGVYLASLERLGLIEVEGGRVRAHRIVRRLLERREGARLGRYHSLAASYYLSEGRRRAALYHLVRGGKYSRALEMLEELYEEYRLELEDGAIRDLIAEMSSGPLNPLERAKLTCFMAAFLEPGQAIKALEAAASEARRWRDDALLARIFQLMGEMHVSRGDYAAASAYATLAASMVRRAGFPAHRLVDDVLGLLVRLGRLEDADELAKHYLRSSASASSRAGAEYWLGVIRALAGDLRAAERRLRESAKCLADVDPLRASRALQYLAYAYARAGRVSKALEHDDRAYIAAIKAGSRLDQLLSLLNKSIHLTSVNRLGAAERLIEEVEKGYGLELMRCRRARLLHSLARARLLASRGLLENAINYVKQAMDAARLSDPLLYAACLLEYSLLTARWTGYEDSWALAEAEKMLEALGDVAGLREALRRGKEKEGK